MRPRVGLPVGSLVAISNQLGADVEEHRHLGLTGVHVIAGSRAKLGRSAGSLPILPVREQRHLRFGNVGLLDDVGQDVVPAMPIDSGLWVDAGCEYVISGV